jgi:hypothetical protein
MCGATSVIRAAMKPMSSTAWSAPMTLSLEERLNQILPRITSRDFLDSKGLGNEIGFWIFDYPPDREMDVRDFLTQAPCCPPWPSSHQPFVRHGRSAELVTELLEERKLLDKAIEMQQTKGDDSTWQHCARCSRKTSWPKKSPASSSPHWIC